MNIPCRPGQSLFTSVFWLDAYDAMIGIPGKLAKIWKHLLIVNEAVPESEIFF
jgi:hypothetical protein